jgi:hypothetical protein
LQKWHFPLSKKYDKIGILCHHKSLFPHLGHFEGGKTILSLDRERKITTLKKLPKQRPKIQIQNKKYN